MRVPHVIQNPEINDDFEAVENYLTAETWKSLEAISAKVEGNGVKFRVENEGEYVRLIGSFTAKEAIASETAIFQLPKGVRPLTGKFIIVLNASTGNPTRGTIGTDGKISWYGVALGLGSVGSFDPVGQVVLTA